MPGVKTQAEFSGLRYMRMVPWPMPPGLSARVSPEPCFVLQPSTTSTANCVVPCSKLSGAGLGTGSGAEEAIMEWEAEHATQV
eukprot:3649478-Rhodomonas_salina.7